MADSEPQEVCSNCNRPIPESKFVLHEAYCRRNVIKCPKCSEMVDRSQLEEHEDEKHKIVECKDCKIKVEIRILEEHNKNCPKKPKMCNFCNTLVRGDEFDTHTYACGSRTKKCLTCNKNILIREFDLHQDLCAIQQHEALEAGQMYGMNLDSNSNSNFISGSNHSYNSQDYHEYSNPLSQDSNSYSNPYSDLFQNFTSSKQPTDIKPDTKASSKLRAEKLHELQQQHSKIPSGLPKPTESKPTEARAFESRVAELRSGHAAGNIAKSLIPNSNVGPTNSKYSTRSSYNQGNGSSNLDKADPTSDGGTGGHSKYNLRQDTAKSRNMGIETTMAVQETKVRAQVNNKNSDTNDYSNNYYPSKGNDKYGLNGKYGHNDKYGSDKHGHDDKHGSDKYSKNSRFETKKSEEIPKSNDKYAANSMQERPISKKVTNGGRDKKPEDDFFKLAADERTQSNTSSKETALPEPQQHQRKRLVKTREINEVDPTTKVNGMGLVSGISGMNGTNGTTGPTGIIGTNEGGINSTASNKAGLSKPFIKQMEKASENTLNIDRYLQAKNQQSKVPPTGKDNNKMEIEGLDDEFLAHNLQHELYDEDQMYVEDTIPYGARSQTQYQAQAKYQAQAQAQAGVRRGNQGSTTHTTKPSRATNSRNRPVFDPHNYLPEEGDMTAYDGALQQAIQESLASNPKQAKQADPFMDTMNDEGFKKALELSKKDR